MLRRRPLKIHKQNVVTILTLYYYNYNMYVIFVWCSAFYVYSYSSVITGKWSLLCNKLKSINQTDKLAMLTY